jgi:hypothetical protein
MRAAPRRSTQPVWLVNGCAIDGGMSFSEVRHLYSGRVLLVLILDITFDVRNEGKSKDLLGMT